MDQTKIFLQASVGLAVGIAVAPWTTHAQEVPLNDLQIHQAIEIELDTRDNETYQVQFTPALGSKADWVDVGDPVPGNGKTFSIFARQGVSKGTFRVQSAPQSENASSILDTPPLEIGLPADPAPRVFGHLSLPAKKSTRENADSIKTSVFERFVKVYNGEPVGDLMEAGEGKLQSARLSAKANEDLEVKRVRVIVEE